jgi:hypothetical protein
MKRIGAFFGLTLAVTLLGCRSESPHGMAASEPQAVAPQAQGPGAPGPAGQPMPRDEVQKPETEPSKPSPPAVPPPLPNQGKSSSSSSQVSAGSNPSVNGALAPELIHRVVRQSFDRFQKCYDAGLRSNPTLQGRVTVRFVIAKDGTTKSPTVAATDLSDKSVATCVANAFSSIAFPVPDRGEVIVSYPVVLSPDGSGARP